MYFPTIGLEIHAELKTDSKMFCNSPHDKTMGEPNTAICPVCTAHPGTLPTINKRAVEFMIMIGLAVNGKIADQTKFDRKNYFYPDLPKGYQISQYDEPIVSGGELKGVHIRRIHLEEDAGRLVHDSAQSSASTLVDYNRASLPLMELVTEPDITTAEQAVAFAKELQLILRYLGASDADMEYGQMRVEANISVRKNVNDPLGTKVEVKNLNSFNAVAGAIAYELQRQEEALEKGEKIVQETRGWDDVHRKTISQRLKEEAHDYRYFPEPDLPPLKLSTSGFDIEDMRRHIPELPQAKRERLMKEYGLALVQADQLVNDAAEAEYFENAVSELKTEEGGNTDAARLSLFNYFISDFRGLLAESGVTLRESKITPENFGDLIMLIVRGIVSSRSAKDILKKMHETGSDPREIVKSEGLEQVSDTGALEVLAKKIIEENPKAIEDFRKGKGGAVQFLVGKAMAAMKGKGNPPMLQEVFKKLLE